MAADAVECGSLARMLALRLADVVAAGIISTTADAGESCLHTTAAIGDGAGDNGNNLRRVCP